MKRSSPGTGTSPGNAFTPVDSHANFLPTLESCLHGTWQRSVLRKNWFTEVYPVVLYCSRLRLSGTQVFLHVLEPGALSLHCPPATMVGTAPSGSASTRWRGAGKGGPLGVLRDRRCCIIGKQVLMRTSVFLPTGLGISSKQIQGCM